MSDVVPLAVGPVEAARMLGIGKTSIHVAISAGHLKAKKFGRRTIIEVSALKQYFDSLPDEPTK